MSDSLTFIDSNVIIYLFSKDEEKKQMARSLLLPKYIISTQVVNEKVNVCLRRLNLSKEEAFAHGQKLLNTYKVVNLYSSTIMKAFKLSFKYSFSYWDSLIVAAALENDCKVLFSEDMQSGLIIESNLTIVNPFKSQ